MRLMRTNIVSGRSRTGNRSSHPALLCRAHLALYLLAVCFLAGTILGTAASVHADTQIMQRFDFLFQTSASLRLSEPVYSLFFASFASSFLFLMICFLCGLSMWGFLFVPAILFFRGYGVGLTAGFLCYTYHWMGALFHLLVLLPGVPFICLALLFSSREAFRASRSLARTGHLDFKIYVMRFGFTLSLAFGAAVVDVITSVCFAGFFSF